MSSGSTYTSKALKPVDYGILCELVKNSRLSDRQLAKILGVSQPTITRRRTFLEKERLLEYTAIPNLKKLGFDVLTLMFGKQKKEKDDDRNVEAAKAFIAKHPNVLFVSTGTGVDHDRVAISVHKSYSDYALYRRETVAQLAEYMDHPISFLISLQGDTMLRKFTLKYLAELIRKEHTEQKMA